MHTDAAWGKVPMWTDFGSCQILCVFLVMSEWWAFFCSCPSQSQIIALWEQVFKTWISWSGLRYGRVGWSGVELKLGARCLYKQILDQALKILFLGARKLTQSPSTFSASPRPLSGYYTTPSRCCNSNEYKMPGQIKNRWSPCPESDKGPCLICIWLNQSSS